MAMLQRPPFGLRRCHQFPTENVEPARSTPQQGHQKEERKRNSFGTSTLNPSGSIGPIDEFILPSVSRWFSQLGDKNANEYSIRPGQKKKGTVRSEQAQLVLLPRAHVRMIVLIGGPFTHSLLRTENRSVWQCHRKRREDTVQQILEHYTCARYVVLMCGMEWSGPIGMSLS